MRIVADLHVHSPYSRATSREMTFENLNIWAKKKGIHVMGTGDFTHPAWFKEIKEKLEEREPGLYTLKSAKNEEDATRFMLTVEISNIYSRAGKTRRVHNIVFSPSIEAAEKLNTKLSWIGNIKSDGRPILGLDSEKLLEIVFGVDDRMVLVPAHAWTPWFSVFGSMSGFDSLEECFGKLTKHIFAIETGLSSDPAMNWRLSALDNIALISNSDSHSLQRIGREANVFETNLSYDGIIEAIKSNNPKKFLYTIEFFPEEGKYHFDGHRDDGHSQSPKESKKAGGKCAKCGKKIIVGVLSRVEELADRPEGYKKENTIPYKSLIPLDEIIADAMGVKGTKSKTVVKEYENLIQAIGSELKVLLDSSRDEISRASNARIAEGVVRVREGRVELDPGYDGEYGKIKIFNEGEKIEEAQSSLF